jgi:hypothetical protein
LHDGSWDYQLALPICQLRLTLSTLKIYASAVRQSDGTFMALFRCTVAGTPEALSVLVWSMPIVMRLLRKKQITEVDVNG